VKIGIPEYELTYLGEPVSEEMREVTKDNPQLDFSIWILDIISFNIEKGFSTTVVDISEFEFISEIFNNHIVGDDIIKCRALLIPLKEKIKVNNHRVFFYVPKDYFLGSMQEKIVTSTCCGLDNLDIIMDWIYPEGGIIVRVGSAYGNRKETMIRFASNFKSLLNERVRNKIMVVNDDRPSLFSVKDLLTELSLTYKIPIVFRTIGHYFNPGSLTHGDALALSISTWSKKRLPLVIHAEPINFNQNGIPESRTISNHLNKRIPTFNKNICVAIESNYKELSCYRYINEYKSLKPVIIDRVKS